MNKKLIFGNNKILVGVIIAICLLICEKHTYAADGLYTYTVLIAYTKNVDDYIKTLGDGVTIESEIDRIIEESNQVYINSGLNIRAACVKILPMLNYTEQPENIPERRIRDMEWFKSNDLIKKTRIESYANVAVLFVSTWTEWNGAYWVWNKGLTLTEAVMKRNPDSAYCIVDIKAAGAGPGEKGNWTFVHELGHIFGCGHEGQNDQAYMDYGHGYNIEMNTPDLYVPPQYYQTIMASLPATKWSGGKAIQKLPFFSSPDLLIRKDPFDATSDVYRDNNGKTVPLGDNSNYDCVRLHRETIHDVCMWFNPRVVSSNNIKKSNLMVFK